jgi:hypothetical protein
MHFEVTDAVTPRPTAAELAAKRDAGLKPSTKTKVPAAIADLKT